MCWIDCQSKKLILLKYLGLEAPCHFIGGLDNPLETMFIYEPLLVPHAYKKA